MELGRTINEETYKALADVLKPEQIKRLKQIQLQRQGTFAFMSPDTQMELKLTDDQKDKIKTIGDDARQEMGALFEEQDQAARQKKMAAFQKETMEKITAVLTDDQKKTWKEMTGEPFEYKPDPGEGFGGGRRGKKKDGV